MALVPDLNIQRSFIERADLPELSIDGKYSLKYRIVSEDGVRSSEWSTKYLIEKTKLSSNLSTEKTILNPFGAITAKYTVVPLAKSHGTSFDVSWKITNTSTGLIDIPEQIKDLKYDAYVQWGGSAKWQYVSTVVGNSFSIPIPQAYQSTPTSIETAQFMVHLATVKKEQTETSYSTLLFYTSPISTEAIYVSGSIGLV